MLYAILALILLLATLLPSIWVRYSMSKHAGEIDDMPGTGGELAEHLLQQLKIDGIKVEQTTVNNDHFDPSVPAVRLSPLNYSGKSLTAIAIAAHEVGHAVQFYRKERVFELRAQYLPTAMRLKKIGIWLIAAAPILGFVVKSPIALLWVLLASLALQLLGALAYLIILPEEWDASFNKALPMLTEGNYIHPHHVEPIRQVLKAAALTYFAGALADLLNIGRWLMVLRR